MKTWIKFLWNTKILGRVSYDWKGVPVDCKGLRYKGKDPFGEDSEYYITSKYVGWDYLGCGVYIKPSCLIVDTENPFWRRKFNEQCRKFSDLEGEG